MPPVAPFPKPLRSSVRPDPSGEIRHSLASRVKRLQGHVANRSTRRHRSYGGYRCSVAKPFRSVSDAKCPDGLTPRPKVLPPDTPTAQDS